MALANILAKLAAKKGRPMSKMGMGNSGKGRFNQALTSLAKQRKLKGSKPMVSQMTNRMTDKPEQMDTNEV